ncbi:MAG: hypothetical protein A2107_13735 [Verrucomicrobia bacterium GWF2_62_7]|nr:MAG: hypothetical protein A2107_13735 [Verrucomicrobia bacterium GWF2_62_7]
MGVWLSKEGYYTAWQTNPHRFEYAQYFDPDFHEPDPKKPVVFMLRKKGVAEPLIHRKLKVNLASDGTPARVGLLRGDESGDAQIELQMWKSSERDEHGRFDWRVVIRTVAGGVLETKEEFPFTAPYGGYQKEVEIKNSVDLGKEWNAGAKVQCFLKFGEPPRYALMKAHILGTSRWAFVECWVNPSGSRNLEYDYQKDVTQQFNK